MKIIFLLSIVLLSFTADYVLAGELKKGKLIVDKVCQTCHGFDGQAKTGGSSAMVPNITAQQKDFLIAKLNYYKSGKIQHHQMNIVASMLSGDDIQNVAEWYSSIKIEIIMPEID